MPINTATKASSSRGRRPPRPARVVLSINAVVGIHRNNTTARDSTRNGNTIEVSFFLQRPPHPSNLFVHSPDLNRCVAPEVVCTVDDLLLLRVNMVCEASAFHISPEHYDYFVYRADPRRPSLRRLQRPHPFFHNDEVGLLPRPDGHYTVAALTTTRKSSYVYKLRLFHSDGNTSSWSRTMVSVEGGAPQNENGYLCHLTTTVITIGGEGGTMGWVDLWRRILLCDVLDSKPSLRVVPLPLPLKEMNDSDDGSGAELGYAGGHRGIVYIRAKGCLKLVHLEISADRLPYNDPETGAPSYRIDDWALKTWTHKLIAGSMEDWEPAYSVQASEIRIDNPKISQELQDCGLLRPRGSKAATAEQRALQNLYMHQPAPCVNGDDVVYIVAREKFMHPKAWICAVDMKNNTLQGVAGFGSQRYFGTSVIYCPSSISKYMYKAISSQAMMNKRAPSVVMDLLEQEEQ